MSTDFVIILLDWYISNVLYHIQEMACSYIIISYGAKGKCMNAKMHGMWCNNQIE